MVAAGLLQGVLCAAVPAAAKTTTVSIPVERDATVMHAHPTDNDGAWGYLWLKWNSPPLENRVLVGFDLAPLTSRESDVLSATITLRAAEHTFPTRGTRIHASLNEPDAVDWVEGDQRFDIFSYCSRRSLLRPPTGTGGPGVTWTCESDTDPVAAEPTCLAPSPPEPWDGGLPAQSDPPTSETRGFGRTPTETSVEVKGYDPLCRKALACFAASASLDCWRKVELDVTSDVRERLASGDYRASWLLRKDRVETGAARFFSREGALCIMGVPGLRPQLVVTLIERPGDPPTIPDPPDHCEASQ
jgi:hypothetical protein